MFFPRCTFKQILDTILISQVEQNYTYYYNICGTVTDYPAACATLPGLGSAAAIQVNQRATTDPTDDWCYNVGMYDLHAETVLIDQEDPSKGIMLTYYGDYCGNHKQRQFHIQLECADKLNPVPTHALELTGCQYTVTIPSVYGCPVECPVGGAQRKLCGGNGFCAYDTDASTARCFCNAGIIRIMAPYNKTCRFKISVNQHNNNHSFC